jgi:enamine deaminase RidA (YjgF/YER057c/UK114 family)
VARIVKLLGFVACPDDFRGTPAVLNGASDLLVELFGERGRHARSAIGVSALPGGLAVEVEMVVEVARAGGR